MLPALGCLAGAALAALAARPPAVPWLAALAAAAMALAAAAPPTARRRRAAGVLLAGVAAGSLAAVATGAAGEPWAAVDVTRPVAASGRVVGHSRRGDWGWRCPMRVERLRQDRTVIAVPHEVWLDLPASVPPPALGAELHLRGYLGRPAGYANRRPLPPGSWRLRVKSAALLRVTGRPRGVASAAGRLRRAVEAALAAVAAPGTEGGHGLALVRALVLGDPDRLPEAWRRGLRRAGLAHLLAVSGLHAGLVAAVAFTAACALPRRARLALAAGAAGGYLLLVGPRPSLLRASLMVLLAAAALASRRAPSAGNALALAAAALVLARPSLVGELGFELTFAATAGIVFVAPRLEHGWRAARRPPPRWLARPLAATLGAQLASLPLALPRLHVVSLLAPGLNLLAVPWTALALACCLTWTGLALLWPAAARLSVPGLDLLAAPFGWPAVGPPAAWGTLVAAAPFLPTVGLALLLVLWLAHPRRRWWLLPAILPLACLTGCDLPAAAGGGIEVVVLDVGQGEAVLLRDGSLAALVDGGGWRHGDFGGRVLLPALLDEGVRRLDAVLLTHPDADHCRGLVDVASYLPVERVWVGPGWEGEPCAAALLATPGAAVRRPAAGDLLRLGRWRLTVLHPPAAARQGRNERSLVVLAEAAGRRLLLTGDIGAATERRLTGDRRRRPACDLLKLAHHGSGGSTSPELLAATRPRLALVSAGPGNPYGHPAPAVVTRLARARIPLLRTDRHGMIRLAWRRDGPLVIELPGYPR